MPRWNGRVSKLNRLDTEAKLLEGGVESAQKCWLTGFDSTLMDDSFAMGGCRQGAYAALFFLGR